MTDTDDLLRQARIAGVVPVLTIEDAGKAVDLAKALAAGGLNILEVTLRTEAAIDAISKIAKTDLDCIIGAGTILSEDDIDAAIGAGAQFLVTPGTPASLIPALHRCGRPVIPGVSTTTEAMTLYAAGFDTLKFFPAEAAGGAPALKSFHGPLADISFMPTGGVRPENLHAYLSLPNVVAVGGTWIAPAADIEEEEWDAIRDRAKAAYEAATASRPSPNA